MKKFLKPWYRAQRKTWYVTLDGRQINLGRDRKAAFAKYKELLNRPKQQRASGESLATIIDAFLDWSQKHRSPETYEWYRYRLQRFIDHYPDLRLHELRPFHVQQWVDGYDISVTTRRNYLRSIKRCLHWAVKQGYLDRSPLEHLETPRGEHRDIVVSQSEYETLLRLSGNGNLRDLLVITWETGCRPQESLRVEARHVDLQRSRWVFPESEGKTGVRIVYLTDEALAITQRQLLKHPNPNLPH